MSAAIILAGILWFIGVALVAVALPSHPGAWALAVIVVPTGAAIAFYRSRLCRQWGKAWDDHARRSRIKMVERGDPTLAGQWAANVVEKEREESGVVASSQPAPSPQATLQQTDGIATEIDRLAGLRQSGALSEEEFTQAKAKLLG